MTEFAAVGGVVLHQVRVAVSSAAKRYCESSPRSRPTRRGGGWGYGGMEDAMLNETAAAEQSLVRLGCRTAGG